MAKSNINQERRELRQEEHMARLRSLSVEERIEFTDVRAHRDRRVGKALDALEEAGEQLRLIMDANQSCSLESGYDLSCRANVIVIDVASLVERSVKCLKKQQRENTYDLLKKLVERNVEVICHE